MVGVIMGSDSDLKVMKEAIVVLEDFEIPVEVRILSAHRTPEALAQFLKQSEHVLDVVIAGAGLAAHLAGVVASLTHIPVIGVPLIAGSLGGMDSLLSMAQMPGGMPVATMAVGVPGAKNAGLFAAQIIAMRDDAVKKKIKRWRESMRNGVLQKDASLNRDGWRRYLEEGSMSK